jgi:hypothetical protein
LCENADDRVVAPFCVDCGFKLKDHEVWWRKIVNGETVHGDFCGVECEAGYVQDISQKYNGDVNGNCTLCGDGSVCGYGYLGQCVNSSQIDYGTSSILITTKLHCIPCSEIIGSSALLLVDDSGLLRYSRNGTCEIVCKSAEYVYENGNCVSLTDNENPNYENGNGGNNKDEEEREKQLAIYLHLNGHPTRSIDHS